MQDIFDCVIMCKNCNVKTRKSYAVKEGFELRVLECPTCSNIIYHPGDLKDFEEYKKLKRQNFDVKLRMVGNSFCVSIPKEIIDFHNDMEREFNKLVRLNLDEPGKINMFFISKKIYSGKNGN